jgi:cell division control protein 6
MFEDTRTRRSVFHSESALDPDADPSTVVGREQEIEQIADALRPLARGNTCEDVLVCGRPGVGKTTCINHVLDRLEEEAGVKRVYINCWQHNTRTALLSELLIKLGYPAPRKGKATDALLTRLRDWVDKNRDVAVVLDEFDRLKDATEIVYDLKEIGRSADHALGLVLVANEACSEEVLDGRSRSRLDLQTVAFDGYEADALQAILEQRAGDAFRGGAVSDHVLRVIADMVAARDGDCRKALNLLRRAGRRADRENQDTVTAEHVQQLQPQSGGQAPV